MFGRAHSCNLNLLRRAIDVWHLDTLYQPVIQGWYDPAYMKQHLKVTIRHVRKANDVLIEYDFSDIDNIGDEDISCVTVATWLNNQFRDYTGRYPNEIL